ncbi:hypothetical protein [Desulfomicrobium baculatum]|nr:hypothetical protein [Desulfomicrobium baculatum]
MKPNQPTLPIREDFLSEKGRLLEDGSDSNSLRVVEFAGHFVPDDGLLISPPTGGELAVWPDGSYAFTSSPATDPGVATHFSYVVETAAGLSFIGSFSLGEETGVSEAMQDFQAWSLPELMDADVAAAELMADVWLETMEGTLHDTSGLAQHAEHLAEHQAAHLAEHLDSATLDNEFDDGLAQLILGSFNS